MDLVDESHAEYYLAVQLYFHGYTLPPSSLFWVPPFIFSSSGSHESAECNYYDNRYISAVMPADKYTDNMSAHVKLEGGVLLKGRVIAEQVINDESVRIDIYFPLSCDDMRNATFYLMDAEKELLAIATYYGNRKK